MVVPELFGGTATAASSLQIRLMKYDRPKWRQRANIERRAANARCGDTYVYLILFSSRTRAFLMSYRFHSTRRTTQHTNKKKRVTQTIGQSLRIGQLATVLCVYACTRNAVAATLLNDVCVCVWVKKTNVFKMKPKTGDVRV